MKERGRGKLSEWARERDTKINKTGGKGSKLERL